VNEPTVTARLHRLAEDLAPDTDPLEQVAGARSRYRRQRRTRVGLTALAAATAAVVIGVPATIGSTSSAPDRGDVAGPGIGTSASDAAQESAARAAAAEASEARSLADQSAATRQAEINAQFIQTVDVLLERPMTLPPAPTSLPCPDVAGALSNTLGVELQYWQGARLADEAPCEWGAGPQMLAPIPDRLAVGATFRAGASVEQQEDAIERNVPGLCYSSPVSAVAPGAVVRVCSDERQARWSLEVPDTGGVGLWEFYATIGHDYPAVTGPAALQALNGLPAASWGG